MGFFFRKRPVADITLLEVAHGSTACMAAVAYLTAINEAQAEQQLVTEWPRAEATLLRCLADCPPDLRPVLADVLQRTHALTEHRATQRGLMEIRRAVIDE